MSKEWCVYTAHVAVAVSLMWVGASRVQGQILMGADPFQSSPNYDAMQPYRASWGLPSGGLGERRMSPEFDPLAREVPTVAPRRDASLLISADRLRNPLSPKALKSISKAKEAGDKGDHEASIRLLIATREKYPSSAPYVHSLLGIEYAKTNQFEKSEDELRHAVALMPHEAVNHSNLAYTLCFLGKFEEAETVVNRALELDKENPATQKIFRVLAEYKGRLRPTP